MKYEVKFSCGHTETISLFGVVRERERKIAYFEKCGVCSECYREQKNILYSIGCDEVEMYYGDYKKSYGWCRTKSGSYNGETKTIIVYVPKKEAERKAADND